MTKILQLAPRRGSDAIAWARGEHEDQGREWKTLCLKFCRTAYGLPIVFPSAASAWDNAQHHHKVTSGNKVPRGVPFFWKGGSQGFGHIVISVGNGLCWSNDILVSGGISLVKIDAITKKWGQQPMGWTEDLNGFRVWTPAELPTVDLSNIRRQYFLALDGKPTTFHPGQVRIQKALNAKYDAGLRVDGKVTQDDLNAWGRHEAEVGVSGRPRIPDGDTLSKLGKGRFRVVA